MTVTDSISVKGCHWVFIFFVVFCLHRCSSFLRTSATAALRTTRQDMQEGSAYRHTFTLQSTKPTGLHLEYDTNRNTHL